MKWGFKMSKEKEEQTPEAVAEEATEGTVEAVDVEEATEEMAKSADMEEIEQAADKREAKELQDAAADLATLKFEVMKKVGDAVGNVQAYKL